MIKLFNYLDTKLALLFSKNNVNTIIINISLFISIAYLIIRFIDLMFLAPANMGDEWPFTRDLIFFLENVVIFLIFFQK